MAGAWRVTIEVDTARFRVYKVELATQPEIFRDVTQSPSLQASALNQDALVESCSMVRAPRSRFIARRLESSCTHSYKDGLTTRSIN